MIANANLLDRFFNQTLCTTGQGLAAGALALLIALTAAAGRANVVDPFAGETPRLHHELPQADRFQLGDFGVTESMGDATHAIEIPVPPGRAGMMPRVSLSYSSRAPLRGGVAAGWSLTLPAIKRDRDRDDSDRERFVASVAGSSGALAEVPDAVTHGGTAYRYEHDESFERFERYEVTAESESWLVRITDGRQLHFGTLPESRDRGEAWLLDREVDARGNEINYHWTIVEDDDFVPVERVIERVEYTRHPGLGIGPHARVRFEYDPRFETCPESAVPVGASLSYRSGAKRLSGSLRMTRIVTEVRDEPGAAWRRVQELSLDYDAEAARCDGPTAPLRLLARVERTAFAPDGQPAPLPPTTFAYGALDFAREFAAPTVRPDHFPHQGTNRDLEGTQLDLDGDGVGDFATARRNASGRCEIVWYPGRLDRSLNGSLTARRLELPTLGWGGTGSEACTLNGQVTFVKNVSGAGSCQAGTRQVYRYADVDGDGDDDLLTAIHAAPGYYDPYADTSISNPRTAPTNPTWPTLDPDDVPSKIDPLIGSTTTADSGTSTRSTTTSLSTSLALTGSATFSSTFSRTLDGSNLGGIDEVDPGTDGGDATPTRDDSLGGTCQSLGACGGIDEVDPNIPEPDTCNPEPQEPQKSSSGDYVWRIYQNTTSDIGLPSFEPMARAYTVAPVPLDPTGNQGTPLGHSSYAHSGHALVDLDGDGRMDVVDADPDVVGWTLHRGRGDGGFEAGRRWSVPSLSGVRAVPSYSEVEGPDGGTRISTTVSGLRDVNGDGLPDFVARRSGGDLLAFFNRGTGFVSEGKPLGTSEHGLDRSTVFGVRTHDYYASDVDGDGLTDLLDLRDGRFEYRPGVGDAYLAPRPLFGSHWERARRTLTRAGTGWRVVEDFADVTGDGLADLVTWTGSELDSVGTRTVHSAAVPGEAPYRLTTVDEGTGRRIRFSYASRVERDVVSAAGSEAERQLPHALWVVDSTTVEDSFGPTAVTEYRYAGAVYDSESGTSDDRPRFLGFRHVETRLPAGGRIERHYGYEGVGDQRARLERELRHDGDQPVTVRDVTWDFASLFGGAARFRFQSETLTRTCPAGATVELCERSTDAVHRQVRTFTPWSLPETGDTALLFATSEREGEGLVPSEWDRVTTHTFDVRYDTGLVLETRRELAEGREALRTVSRREQLFDASGLLVEQRNWIAGNDVAVIRRDYDAAGNLVRESRPEQLSTGLARVVDYDAWRLFPVRSANELGHVVDTRNDVGTGAVLERSGPNPGQQDVFRIDGLGRMVAHHQWIDGLGLVEVERQIHADLDLPRRRVAEKLLDASSGQWAASEVRFDGSGRVIEEVDPVGAIRTHTYRADGAPDWIELPDPTTDTGRRVSFHFEYDGLGRFRSLLRPDGSRTEVVHEGLTRLIEESGADGSATHRFEDRDVFGRLAVVEEAIDGSHTAVTQYFYDAADRVVEIENADGHVTSIDYDGAGRRVRIERSGRSWHYAYDLDGNLIAETSPVPPGALAEEYTTHTTYDVLGRVVNRSPATRELDPQRLAELGIGDATYHYDGSAGPADQAVGRLSRVTLPFGHVEYTYDGRGMAILENRSFQIAGVEVAQWEARSFDAAGRRIRVEHDDGSVWATTYDARSLADRVDWLDPRTGTFRSVAHFERSLAGQPRQRLSDFGQSRTMAYDELGRPVVDEVRAGGVLLAWREYGFDGIGDLVTVRGANGAVPADADFIHDGLHRVVSASGPVDYQADLSYSSAGNVTSARIGWPEVPMRDVTYQYGNVDPQAVDRLMSGSLVWGAFGYDAAGNTVRRETPEGLFELAWDGEDQLLEVAGPEGLERYLYDHEGQRVAALDADGLRVWFGPSETLFLLDGRMQSRRIHLSAGGATLARVERAVERQTTKRSSKSKKRDPRKDGAGSTTTRAVLRVELQYADAVQNLMLAVDEQGQPSASFLYGAFGEVVHEEGGDAHRRQFNGKEHDATTGLRYYGARYYDPLTLRWSSADPLYRAIPDQGLEEPQHMNLYAFSLNNPLRYYDPDGRKSFDVHVVIVPDNNHSKAERKQYNARTKAAVAIAKKTFRKVSPKVKFVSKDHTAAPAKGKGVTTLYVMPGRKVNSSGISAKLESLAKKHGNKINRVEADGALGAALIGGNVALVNVDAVNTDEALGNVINHELAHSIGLDHCEQRGCADDVMEPATKAWGDEVKSFRGSEVRELRRKINRRAH